MNEKENTVQGPELVLSQVQRAHAGDYICRADNGVGRGAARETVSLEIRRKYLQIIYTLSTHYLHIIYYMVPLFLGNTC